MKDIDRYVKTSADESVCDRCYCDPCCCGGVDEEPTSPDLCMGCMLSPCRCPWLDELAARYDDAVKQRMAEVEG